MEAKETVMSPHEIDEARAKGFDWNNTLGKSLLEAQVEITWPIAHRQGMREVVEFYKSEQVKAYGYPLSLDANWQAFLKEKGL